MSEMAGAGKHLNNLEGKVESLGEITGRWSTVMEVGSCNFCSRYYAPERPVLNIEGNKTNVRMCKQCWEKLKGDAKT